MTQARHASNRQRERCARQGAEDHVEQWVVVVNRLSRLGDGGAHRYPAAQFLFESLEVLDSVHAEAPAVAQPSCDFPDALPGCPQDTEPRDLGERALLGSCPANPFEAGIIQAEFNPGVTAKGPGKREPGKGKGKTQPGKARKPDGRGSEEVVD